jgi:hypothetical protein
LGHRGNPLNQVAARDYSAVWEAAGRRTGEACDGVFAVAVLGDDPVATAAAALGIARSQALRRRVVIADLLGGNSDLSMLVNDPEAPGVTDMLEFGVSLGRAAHRIAESANRFIIPPGSESPLHEIFFTHPRWGTLVEDFRDAGALLLLVAPALVPASESLLDRLDGVVTVRGAAIPPLKVPVVADVRLSAQHAPPARRTPPMARARMVPEPRRSRGWLVALGIVVLAALAAGVWYIGPWRAPGRREALQVVAPRDSSSDSAAAVAAAPATVLVPLEWSVEIALVNSLTGVMLRVGQVIDSFPATTYSPILPAQSGGARWYRVVTGASRDSSAADSLLVSLRAKGSATEAARVVHTPFTLLVADSVSEADASLQASELRGRGLPAYVMRTAAGQARVYVGAFDSAEAAQTLAAELDSLKLPATLVTRVGGVS